ncbi:type IV toxin-antitoxin system AbiEi family antitoxin domain-containing protein [Rhizobium sp. 22-785-1]
MTKNLQLSSEKLYSAKELEQLGYSRTATGRLMEAGILTSPLRGVYRATGGEDAPLFDKLGAMSKRCPNAVFFLFTAAAVHDLVVRDPSYEHIGLPPSRRAAPIFSDGDLPLDVVRWSRLEDCEIGVDTYRHLEVDIRVTSPERTLFDLWRYSFKNPTLKGTHERVTDENLFDCFAAYFEKVSRDTCRLGDLAAALETRSTTLQAYGDFLLTFERGFNARLVF